LSVTSTRGARPRFLEELAEQALGGLLVAPPLDENIAAFFERGTVSVVQGVSKTYTRNSAVGKLVTFHFCPECGSTVFWEPERMPRLIGFAVGAFADPSFPQPEQSVWTNDKHAWLSLPGDIRAFGAMPPPRSPSG